MKNFILLASLFFVVGLSSHSQTVDSVFFSEFHYDNIGADTLEGFEISGLAGTDLSCYTVYFYNGSNGLIYSQDVLEGIIPNQLCDFGAVWFNVSSIQNGFDAIALYNNCTNSKLQFISYEGVLVANDGPFSGDTSLQVTVVESNSAIGSSLQFLGINSDFTDSLWVGPVSHSIGLVNALNPPCSFSVALSNLVVESECQSFGLQELSVQLTNTSNSNLDTFIISYSFQDSVYSDSILQTVSPDSVLDYIFQDSILFSSEGDFTINCTLDAIKDGQTFSDSITITDSFIEFDSLTVSDLIFNICIEDTISLQASDLNGDYFTDTSSVSWTTIVNQDSIFQLMVSNQCQTDSFSITINVSELDLGPNVTLCTNDTISINAASIFNSYSWSNGDSTSQVSLTQAGSLSLLVQDSVGCFLSDTIVILQSVDVDLGVDLEKCIGDTILISCNFDEGSFQWSTGDTSVQILTFTTSSISLEYTSQNGCVSSDTISVEFIDCDTTMVSVNNNASLEFSVFPNPVKDYLYISNLENDNQQYNYQIFDSLGRVLIDEKLSKTNVKIDIQEFNRGIYFLQIEKNKKIENHKILIL